MTETVCEMVDTLLESVQHNIEDPELQYKLRTARQLNLACHEELRVVNETLAEADLDPELVDTLKDLGYL